MAVGRMFSGFVSVDSNDVVSIRPSSGVEVVLHNIYFSGPVVFYISNGTDDIPFENAADAGGLMDVRIHISYTYFIKVKNVSSSTINVAWDGVITAEV